MPTTRNFRFYGLFIVLVLLGLVLASQPAGKKPRHQNTRQENLIRPIDQIEDIKISNRTSSFTPVEIKKISADLFAVTYRNDYAKNITGFEVSIGGMRIQTELTLGGDEREFILPGRTFQETYAPQEGLERIGVQILAVVFDNGTGDGDTKYVKEITDYRMGMTTERQRLLKLLDQVLASKNQDIAIALGALEAQLTAAIPSTQQDSKLDNVAVGIRNESRRILDEIRMLKAKHQSAQTDAEEAEQLRNDLVVMKVRSESVLRLAVPLGWPGRSTQ